MRQNVTTRRTSTPPISPEAPTDSLEAPEPKPNAPTQAFYTVPELADRWRCSETQVRRLLAMDGAKVLDMAEPGKKGKKLIPIATVRNMESKRTKRHS